MDLIKDKQRQKNLEDGIDTAAFQTARKHGYLQQ